MSDHTTTSSPTMGTSASRAQAMQAESPNVKFRPKGGGQSGDPGGPTGHRQGQQERMGATYAPQVNVAYQIAPESGETYRNVKLVPSAIGNRDFYNKRQFGQTGDFG